ncbi:MAG TPA: 16S rRNA (adenine(1518)-N(6)/adenine(1519)-N(6))-dimethyltransferase RsmA [Candidatus Limnocylindria bacterium]|nr:16S rRNA (adenine(1518)-N(6)/adenine(1519)-N(6))-dimethyltransferase RsmA [Candidatus Limnocylindria bacterium]
MGLRREARDALAATGRRPRKRWGQHFLCDERVIARIVAAARLTPDAVVLEIGPGLGALTDALAERCRALFVVEIDPVLVERLTARYADRDHVRVLAGDALALPLAELVPRGAVVVANLPYNISTAVLMRLCELRAWFPRAVLMLQREVAERLVAPAGGRQRGVLGVMVQTYGDVRTVLRVPRSAFLPPPAVESVVVEVAWHSAPRVAVPDPVLYGRVVRGAFSQRRKMLRNALMQLGAELGLEPAALEAALERSGIDPTLRAERLELADFARLTDALRS